MPTVKKGGRRGRPKTSKKGGNCGASLEMLGGKRKRKSVNKKSVKKVVSKKLMKKSNKKVVSKKSVKKVKRKPSAYNMHIKAEMKKGKTMKEAAASWKAKK